MLAGSPLDTRSGSARRVTVSRGRQTDADGQPAQTALLVRVRADPASQQPGRGAQGRVETGRIQPGRHRRAEAQQL
ncbi:hypothetical protein, partial [Micromonospora foliorum]|uniref:hypothetical protein n=1 Tax=Micromonospora foliorum TaxID=2911210 RepID=UPI001EE90037